MKAILIIMAMMSSLFLAGTSLASDKVNINTATAKQLESVKGIGPKTAEAIVKYRKKHGRFSSVEDLKKVKGIGEKKLKKVKGSLKAGKGKAKEKAKKKDKKKHKKDMKDKKKSKDKK